MKRPVKITFSHYLELGKVRTQWAIIAGEYACHNIDTWNTAEVMTAAKEAGFKEFAAWLKANIEVYHHVQTCGWDIVPDIEMELLKIFGASDIEKQFRDIAGKALLEYIQTTFPAVNEFTTLHAWHIHPDKKTARQLVRAGVVPSLSIAELPDDFNPDNLDATKIKTTPLKLREFHFGIGNRHFHQTLAYEEKRDTLWYRDDIDPKWIAPPCYMSHDTYSETKIIRKLRTGKDKDKNERLH